MAGKQQKGRKIGRNRDRNPSSKAYTAAKRWVSNKAKCAKRHTRRMARKAIHRIEWQIRTRRSTLQIQAGELQRLRHIVSQNL